MIQPPLEARIDHDLHAYRTGPAALDHRLEQLPAAEITARYRALIARVELRAALRRRDTDTALIRHELATERAALLRGGNR